MSFAAQRFPRRVIARPLALGLAVPLTLLAATAFLVLRYWDAQQMASQSVRHSRHVIGALDRLGTSISDAAAQRRAHLLARNPVNLEPSIISDIDVRRAGEALRALVADDR